MLKTADAFYKKSVFTVLALCVITFGMYVILRLWQLTKIVNSKSENYIPPAFTISAVSIHIISLVGLVYYLTFPAPTEILIITKALHLLSSIFHIVWIIKVRNRINTINRATKGNKLWLNPFLSGLFHVIYFQHKINQSIESTGPDKLAI
jgi:hypothetical protein